jgi:ABC-type transport system substrate-binding protein
VSTTIRNGTSPSALLAIWLAIAVTTVSCAAPGPSDRAGPAGAASQAEPQRTKHVNALLLGQPTNFVARVAATQISLPGIYNLEQLVNASLIELDGDGVVRPQLALATPSLENGQWRTFPDGRMETTWTIRPGAAWHDGQPLTTVSP